ncbi:hypothetical protein K440DRAFT_640162 [Wilcoxina mikolae CBS 423.85]|nr:hypothetical protein K440DRAFT_640162 [Wilcoxina mikolae CBS 423.85]
MAREMADNYDMSAMPRIIAAQAVGKAKHVRQDHTTSVQEETPASRGSTITRTNEEPLSVTIPRRSYHRAGHPSKEGVLLKDVPRESDMSHRRVLQNNTKSDLIAGGRERTPHSRCITTTPTVQGAEKTSPNLSPRSREDKPHPRCNAVSTAAAGEAVSAMPQKQHQQRTKLHANSEGGSDKQKAEVLVDSIGGNDKMSPHNKHITMSTFVGANHRSVSQILPKDKKRVVQLSGISKRASEATIREVAALFGKVEAIHLDYSGEGYVRYVNSESAARFFDKLNGSGYNVRLIEDGLEMEIISLANSKSAGISSATTIPGCRKAEVQPEDSHHRSDSKCVKTRTAGSSRSEPAVLVTNMKEGISPTSDLNDVQAANPNPERSPILSITERQNHDEVYCVHICDISPTTTHNDIYSRICKYGIVHDIRKLEGTAGFLVDFESVDAAQNCIRKYNVYGTDMAKMPMQGILKDSPPAYSQWIHSRDGAQTSAAANTETSYQSEKFQTISSTENPNTPIMATTRTEALYQPAKLQQASSNNSTFEEVQVKGAVQNLEDCCVVLTRIRPWMRGSHIRKLMGQYGSLKYLNLLPKEMQCLVTFNRPESAARCLKDFQNKRHKVQIPKKGLFNSLYPLKQVQSCIEFVSSSLTLDRNTISSPPPDDRPASMKLPTSMPLSARVDMKDKVLPPHMRVVLESQDNVGSKSQQECETAAGNQALTVPNGNNDFKEINKQEEATEKLLISNLEAEVMALKRQKMSWLREREQMMLKETKAKEDLQVLKNFINTHLLRLVEQVAVMNREING